MAILRALLVATTVSLGGGACPTSKADSYQLNPVRAGLVEKPEAYAWSSAKAHLVVRDDRLVGVSPLLEMVGDWGQFLPGGIDSGEAETSEARPEACIP